jgi:hypothetical protein
LLRVACGHSGRRLAILPSLPLAVAVASAFLVAAAPSWPVAGMLLVAVTTYGWSTDRVSLVDRDCANRVVLSQLRNRILPRIAG